MQEKRSKDLSQPTRVLVSALAISKNEAFSQDRSKCPDSFLIQRGVMSWKYFQSWSRGCPAWSLLTGTLEVC